MKKKKVKIQSSKKEELKKTIKKYDGQPNKGAVVIPTPITFVIDKLSKEHLSYLSQVNEKLKKVQNRLKILPEGGIEGKQSIMNEFATLVLDGAIIFNLCCDDQELN